MTDKLIDVAQNLLNENFTFNSISSCLENLNDVAKQYLTNTVVSTLDLASPNVSYSFGEIEFNAGLNEISIETPLGDVKFDPEVLYSNNLNDTSKEYLIDVHLSTIGDVDLNIGSDEIRINTPLGDFALDPNDSFTKNLTNIVAEILGDTVNEKIDQFCSDFNDVAHIETDGSLYSDGTNSLLTCQLDADASISMDGIEASAQADGSFVKHKFRDIDINIGQGQVYAKAFINIDGMEAVTGGALNIVSFKHENIQANIGLNTKTGIDLSTNNMSASVIGLGFNAGTDGIGISTPIGSINVNPWD